MDLPLGCPRWQCGWWNDLLLDGAFGQNGMDREILPCEKEKLDRASAWVHKRGAWMAFFAFIPILGSAITVALGLLRANVWGTVAAMSVGKWLRYAAVIWGTEFVTQYL